MRTASILRFAPSPNGRLHLGHAFSALFTARAAAALGGVFILRIEDIDPARSRPEFEAHIQGDLAWLGLSWAEPIVRQSRRMAAYAQAAEALKKRDLLYPCFCTRRDIAAASTGQDPDGAPLYPGTCRNLPQAEVARRLASGMPVQWRLRMDHALDAEDRPAIIEAPASGIDARWDDIAERRGDPARWGDVVLIRKDTPTSYHLSVVVDDAWQGITHVTRGMDLHAATDLHALLQRLLDLPSPVYCHHRLLRGHDGQKLAKSKGSPSFASLRERGLSADAIRRELGFGPRNEK